MKRVIYFIILVTFLGCGKKPKIDSTLYRDDDGDQIVDRNEISNRDKLIANFISMERVMGEIYFYEGISQLRKYTLTFTNDINLDHYALDLLLKNREALKTEHHFSEFTHLKLNSEVPKKIFDQKKFQLYFRFKTLKSRPKRLYFIRSDGEITSFPWQQEMNLKISKENLLLFMKGQAHFVLEYLEEQFQSFPQTRSETIKAKTYRIILHDSQKTQVVYISKKLEFKEILAYFKIKDAFNIDEVNLLNAREDNITPSWWYRILSEDDIVIVKQSEPFLKKHFSGLFEKQNHSLLRLNGFSMGEIKWKKSTHSRMVLRLKGFKTALTFKIKKDQEFRGGGKDGDRCEYTYNMIDQTTFINISTQDILDSVKLTTDGQEAQHQIIFKELNHEWEIEIPEGIQEISLNITNFEKSMYQTTGLIKATCGGLRTFQTAIEGQFNLDITSFVEKI